MLKVMASGIFFGLCSILLIESLNFGKFVSGKVKLWPPLKAIMGGAGLVGLTFLFSPKYLGLGLTSIESCLRGEPTEWYAFLLKPVFTGVTLGFGGSGGIVTPIFFIGSAAGNLFARLSGLNIATFSAIGLVSVLAGAANTPIAASILAMDMFGSAIAPYATVACVISFLFTGHRSVYPSQVLSVSKSSSLDVELGKDLESVSQTYHSNDSQLLKKVRTLSGQIKGGVRKASRKSAGRKSE